MIRRIKRSSDLRDLIKSCPSGVIDDIYKIEYYIQGYGDTVEAEFTKKGTMLEVILPTSLLEELPNGVLMRRAYYKTTDSSFPDGEYNLEFEDNMGVWLGDDEGSGPSPAPGEYVTEEELADTLADYATQDWVGDQGYITSSDLSGYATKNWVSSQNYVQYDDPGVVDVSNAIIARGGIFIGQSSGGIVIDTENRISEEVEIIAIADEYGNLEKIATQDWVINQKYTTADWLRYNQYVQASWVQNQGYITSSALSGYATESYVDQAIEDAIFGSDIPLPENIVEYDEHHPLIEEFDLNVDVLKRPEFDHGTDVMTKGLVLGYTETKDNNVVTDIDTIEIRDSLLMAVSYSYDGVDYYESRDPYVTQSWIGNQGYITTASLSGYATEQWVGQQGYITSAALSGYATETWVGNQGYITSSALSGYATESWATNQFLEESKVWTGTQSQWNNLTAAQKASYTIALITQ